MWEQVQQTVSYIKEKTNFTPEYGVILGSGLGSFTDDIKIEFTLPYSEIPNFPVSTVEGHKGALVFGTIGAKKVVAMQGRFHFYEGYDMKQVTFPVRVMKALNVQHLFLSNVAGSVNQHLLPGDIVFINDHINLLGDNPLRGVNDERLGVRFPEMMDVYDPNLIKNCIDYAHQHNIRAHTGVYAALQGPNLETKAEYIMLNRIGADLVGMSTVPEVIVAKHSNMTILAASVVSNQCYPPELIKETSVEDVIAVGRTTEPKLRKIYSEIISNL
mgnify:CR=1 FL=1